MKPAIGRIVNFVKESAEVITLPAIITRVYSDVVINLRIFNDEEPHELSKEFKSSVVYDGFTFRPGTWSWPI